MALLTRKPAVNHCKMLFLTGRVEISVLVGLQPSRPILDIHTHTCKLIFVHNRGLIVCPGLN
jgi:hypothetical protein